MNNFDNELNIIEYFQSVDTQDVFFVNKSIETEQIFMSILDEEQWQYWISNCKKNDPPPDFYSDKYNLMMEVMRIDDHAYINEKGKTINPSNIAESKIQKEIKNSGILEAFPNVKNIFVNADTHLTTEEDHSYKNYKENFIRIINKHNSQISLYKHNFPNKKIIFFLMDESSAYYEADDNSNASNAKIGDTFRGVPHFCFFDKSFISIFEESEVDYFIWYTPFKLIRTFDVGMRQLPKVCVFDNTIKMDDEYIKYQTSYNDDKMRSVEI